MSILPRRNGKQFREARTALVVELLELLATKELPVYVIENAFEKVHHIIQEAVFTGHHPGE